MFTDAQIEILNQLDPYIDGEQGESRKGRSQIYPLIHIKKGDIYWCEKSEDLLHVPYELVGDWIATELVDEGYYDSWKTVNRLEWKRAERKTVTIEKWGVAEL